MLTRRALIGSTAVLATGCSFLRVSVHYSELAERDSAYLGGYRLVFDNERPVQGRA